MTDWQAITPSDAAAFLNELLNSDPEALNALFRVRIPCNHKFRDHPTLQVWCEGDNTTVRVLGLLNGMFGVDAINSGPIAAVYDDATEDSRINSFIVRRKARHEKADG